VLVPLQSGPESPLKIPVHLHTDQQNEPSVVPDTRMPLLLVVKVRPNLASLELVALVEAVDSLEDR
jgi:hypothetical protein